MVKPTFYIIQTLSAIFQNQNRFDFFAKGHFLPPTKEDLRNLRKKEKVILSTYFNPVFISEAKIKKAISEILPTDRPIVSLENLFLKKSNNTFLLDFSTAAHPEVYQLVPRYSSRGKTVQSMFEELVDFLKKRKMTHISLFDMTVYRGISIVQLQEVLNKYDIKIDTAYCIFAHKKALSTLQELQIDLKYKYLADSDFVDEHDFFIVPQSGKSFFYKDKEVKLVRFFPFGNPCRRFILSPKEGESFSKDLIELNIELYQKMENLNHHRFKISELPQPIYNLPYEGMSDENIIDFLRYALNNLKTWD